MSLDPLQCIPSKDWHKLKSVFKSDWPRSITGFTLLETQEYILKKGLDYGFKVYCPYGDVNKGMIAINPKGTFYEIIIQHAGDETTHLEYALLNSKVIDWSKNYSVPYLTKHISDCVRKVTNTLKINFKYMFSSETFILNKRTPFKVKLPTSFSFELLSLDYIKQVNAVWPHAYPGSEWYFELLTNAEFGYGLFKNKDLISWIYLKEMGALGHLYTMDDYRRKGYGELVLKMVSNILIKQGRTVFAFCDIGNVQARALYEKLGFDNVQNIDRCAFQGM